MMGSDEYHANVTDSAFGNAVGAASLMAAYEYATRE
jgi:trehalose/maltose hydrolase-like predicted phosphorylase